MGWYKAKCHRCHDSHEGTCEEFQRARVAARQADETNRLLRGQNELLRKLANPKESR